MSKGFMSKGKYYYVEMFNGTWFVCFAENQRQAFSCGVQEYGRGQTVLARRATNDELEQYCREKSIDLYEPHWNGTRLDTKEETRQFQLRA